jgi:hypothetical protein
MKNCFSKFNKTTAVALLGLIISSNLLGQQKNKYTVNSSSFNPINENSIVASSKHRTIIPSSYSTVSLNTLRLKKKLSVAKKKSEFSTSPPLIIVLPNPDGSSSRYRVYKNTTMHPVLEANFSEIRTFDGVGIDHPGDVVKFDLTPHGFHAMILTANKGTIFIDPYTKGNTENYQVYYKRDYANRNPHRFSCQVEETTSLIGELGTENVFKKFGTCELRTYRLALSCTGEYAAAVGGGTVIGALAAQVTTMNRVNGIYERALAVTMTIVANNNLIIYTNSMTDPYANGNAGSLINESQLNIDNVIGNANYDIGHTFSTGGGGLAGLGIVCIEGSKGRGITGNSNPQGDAYDIDYVAHEIGHQFGGNHTFHGTGGACAGNRNLSTAYEPGSGSSIMSYAGICINNVENNSDAFFHSGSLAEIGATLTGSADVCPVKTALINVSPSLSGTNGNVTIPKGTPFALTLSATDPDVGNTLTYTWEQMDIENSPQPPQATSTGGPNFRSFLPSTSPTRYFPNLTALNNNGPFTWEVLPTVSRTMHFRGVVRDNSSGGGCTDHTDVTVTVDANSGPFVLNAPSATGITWPILSTQNVTWNEAGTANAPVSCATVNLLLSTDGGLTYPTVLASNVPNDGIQSVTVPNSASTTAKIMVTCSNGTFFDISDNNFTIAGLTTDFTLTANPTFINNCTSTTGTTRIEVGSIGGYNDVVNLTVTGLPVGASSNFSSSSITPTGTSILTINTGSATAGVATLAVQGVSTSGTKTVAIILTLGTPSIPLVVVTNNCGNSELTTSGTGLLWSTGETTASITVATGATYTVTQSFDGCTSLPGSAIANPTVIDTTVSISGSIITSNQTGSAYRWLACDSDYNVIPGENSQNYTATSSGNYAVEITKNGCVDTSACSLILTIGIENPLEFEKLFIYPNPAKKSLTVSGLEQAKEISLIDLTGKVVFHTFSISEKSMTIDLTTISNGMYFLQVRTEKKLTAYKVIKH